MKTNLAVIFGSRTCEHDVSIISGLQAAHAADTSRYQVTPVYIGRDGAWYTGQALMDIAFYTHFDASKVTRVRPEAEGNRLALYKADHQSLFRLGKAAPEALCDVVLPVMHGLNGEDGTLQGMLELWNIPYTSSGVLGSSVGMDKIAMKQLFRGCGFPVLPDTWADRADWERDRDAVIARVEAALPYPVYVKPSNLGSSIGISRANDRQGLIHAMDVACAYDRRILIEKGVTHISEVNCSVLGYAGEAQASVLEMPGRVEDADLLDFNKKYLSGGKGGKGAKGGMSSLARRIPAPISDDLTKKIQDMSLKVFRACDCKGVVRIDYILDTQSGEWFVGEINTIPGSLAFYLWEATGLRFSGLIDKMVEYALAAHKEKNKSQYSFQSDILTRQVKGAKTR